MRGKHSLFSRSSLKLRLLKLIVGAQALAVLLAIVAFPFDSPYLTPTDIAARSTELLVRHALVRDTDGMPMIRPFEPLLQYAARRPGLLYAALDQGSGKLAMGSSPALLPVLARLRDATLRDHANVEFVLPQDGHRLEVHAAGQGGVLVVSANNAFGWDDAPAFALSFMPALLPIFLPVLFAALVIVPLVVARSMSPVQVAADEASEIDMRSLDRRLSSQSVPLEIRPLVEAINALLDRLRDGLARERLFAANAAHELRTPVAILLARIDAGQGDARHKQELKRDAQRIGLLVEQLLAVARLDHHGVRLDETIELVACVRSLIADRAPLAIRMRRNLVFNPPRRPVLVLGHARALESAIANLLDNALAMEPEDGSVLVGITVTRGGAAQAMLEISDHGPGIAPEDRELVFQPFWRKDERPVGSGLGLTIAQTVVSRHGGTIAIAETPGGGATLRVTLPCQSPQPAVAKRALV